MVMNQRAPCDEATIRAAPPCREPASGMAGRWVLAVMGIVVAAVFSNSLDSHLDALHATPSLRHALDAQRTRLAAVQAPAGLPPAERAALRHAVGAAFLDGFRVAMLTGAGLAALSALVAAVLVQRLAPVSGPVRQQSRTPGGVERQAG